MIKPSESGWRPMPSPSITCPVCRFETRRVFRDDLCTLTLEREGTIADPRSKASCPARCCPNLWHAAVAAGLNLETAVPVPPRSTPKAA
jgi:hypothetical protein